MFILDHIVNRRKSDGAQQSQQQSNDDFYFGYEETIESRDVTEMNDENLDENEDELYFPADVNINVDEALVGLEDLLDE